MQFVPKPERKRKKGSKTFLNGSIMQPYDYNQQYAASNSTNATSFLNLQQQLAIPHQNLKIQQTLNYQQKLQQLQQLQQQLQQQPLQEQSGQQQQEQSKQQTQEQPKQQTHTKKFKQQQLCFLPKTSSPATTTTSSNNLNSTTSISTITTTLPTNTFITNKSENELKLLTPEATTSSLSLNTFNENKLINNACMMIPSTNINHQTHFQHMQKQLQMVHSGADSNTIRKLYNRNLIADMQFQHLVDGLNTSEQMVKLACRFIDSPKLIHLCEWSEAVLIAIAYEEVCNGNMQSILWSTISEKFTSLKFHNVLSEFLYKFISKNADLLDFLKKNHNYKVKNNYLKSKNQMFCTNPIIDYRKLIFKFANVDEINV